MKKEFLLNEQDGSVRSLYYEYEVSSRGYRLVSDVFQKGLGERCRNDKNFFVY